jgi:hypothetical protein
MRNFWTGVFAGVVATMLIGGLLGFVVAQHARAELSGGSIAAPPFIRGILEHHGEFGSIEEIGDRSLTLLGRAGSRQTFSIGDDTEIYRGRTKIGLSDLSTGLHVIVIAKEQPDGSLKARLIRVMGASFLLEPLKSGGS